MKLSLPSSKSISCKNLIKNTWDLNINYKLIEEIGHGSYGHVYKAIDNKTNLVVAIKKIIQALINKRLAQYCLRELEILSELSHPNIIKLHQVMNSNRSIYLIMDYMPFDLKSLICSRFVINI